MGQCTIRWSNGHCPWSILPVGEANGNFLYGKLSNGSYPLDGGFRLAKQGPVGWPNGHRGGCPSEKLPFIRWPGRAAGWAGRPLGRGRAPLFGQTDRYLEQRK